jgi:hypothetical protein
MRSKRIWVVVALIAMPVILGVCITPSALPIETAQEAGKQKMAVTKQARVPLTVLNPQGPVKKNRALAPRLGTLDGKKVALWLSATPDQVYAGKGAELYDLLAKMLKGKYANIKIVPYTDLPMKFAPENEVVAAITAAKPDGVVAAFGG